MTDKKDVFYFASLYGVSIFYQPEDNEIVPRNAFCGFVLDICLLFAQPICDFLGIGFPIKIYNRTITRQELKELGVLQ